jgi:hypothetical protein
LQEFPGRSLLLEVFAEDVAVMEANRRHLD